MVKNIVSGENIFLDLQRYESFSFYPNSCAVFFDKTFLDIVKCLFLLLYAVSVER